MNAPLRKVSIAIFVLFALLFANLNWVQYVRGDDYRTNPLNRRVLLSEYSTQRGSIVVDGQAIASVQETEGHLKYLRTYPARGLYPHITGYKSPQYGDTGVEQSEDSVLSGDDDRLFVRQLGDMVTGRKAKGGNVVLTVSRAAQKAAFDALGGRRGAVVALDPKTGKILALVSGPTYDPNELASHDTETREKAWEDLNSDESKPLLNRALNETYPPGSTFKVIVSAAALKEGYTPSSQVESPMSYTPPQTTMPIQNFEGESCGGDEITLEHALTVSCNTSYAKLGVKLGKDKISEEAREFGFEINSQRCPLKVSPSELGDIPDDAALAQSSIGQRDVRMTPLQGAMMASAVANGGDLMQPYLVNEVQAPDLSVLDKTQPKKMSQPLTSDQASQLRQMMKSVVDNGTGTKARISGIDVGGKTGTAQDGDARQDHDWFIGYANDDDGKPAVAVGVVLENAGQSSGVSAQVAGTVMKAVLNDKGSN